MRYFAYGSNLDGEQMYARCPTASAVTTAFLEGHALVFAGHSRRWGGAVATVAPVEGRRVPGVIYEIDEAGLGALDRHEGVPDHYQRVLVAVVAPSGKLFDAWTYIKPAADSAAAPPPAAYIATLRRAYAHLGFDQAELDRAVAPQAG
jgi:gamma-glutamylcyclotransferase (GGCT)/AIG2-like uncharacterized protein YtfP